MFSMGWTTGLLLCVGLVIVVGLVGYAIASYNGLVRLRNAFKNAFAQIDVQLTRRHDLIPNLVETAKGYMKHERETLEAVVAARSAAVNAQSAASAAVGDPNALGQLAGAENVLTATLGRMFALAEAYPDLKANQNMLALQEELTSTENKVTFARQAFNDAATAYNIRREVFPALMVASVFGFMEASLLETAEAERAPPKVSFQ